MDTVNQLLPKKERLNSDLAIQRLCLVTWRKRPKVWKFRYRRMSTAIVVIALNFLASFDTLNDGKFKKTIIEVCKDININVSEIDIEACHRLPVIPNAANVGKKVIV